jgi:acetyl esterase/lipase
MGNREIRYLYLRRYIFERSLVSHSCGPTSYNSTTPPAENTSRPPAPPGPRSSRGATGAAGSETAINASFEQLKGLPQTLLFVDALRDEGEAYGRKLAAAGVTVTSVR